MTSSTASRGAWRKVRGCWTLSLGTRGNRVRIFEKRDSRIFWRDVWANGKKSRRSLKTKDRAIALDRAKALLAALDASEDDPSAADLTLGTLWDRFSTENPQWLDNRPHSRADDERSAKILIAHFGREHVVSLLDENDQRRYADTRAHGGIVLDDGTVLKPVKQRTVQADLVLLHAMLRWATRRKLPSGCRLLDRHPLEGVRIVGEDAAVRPITTWDRYLKTQRAMRILLEEARGATEWDRWLKMSMALAIAEATGRRLGAIRMLRWDDIDLVAGEIRWRKENDKKRRESVVPIPPALLEKLEQFCVLSCVTQAERYEEQSEFLFAAYRDPRVPMDRHLFDHWLCVAEEHAGLPKLEGGLWHPYRRKWATERKDQPIADVMAAGGWADAETVLRSYQQTDRETLRRVVNNPKRLRDDSAGEEAPTPSSEKRVQ